MCKEGSIDSLEGVTAEHKHSFLYVPVLGKRSPESPAASDTRITQLAVILHVITFFDMLRRSVPPRQRLLLVGQNRRSCGVEDTSLHLAHTLALI